MIVFEELKVQAVNLTNQIVTWSVQPTNESFASLPFIIERSASQAPGSFEEVGRVTNQFYFLDKNGAPVSKWANIFYRLRFVDQTGRGVVSEPFTIDYRPSARVLQAVKYKSIVFRHTDKGRESLVYGYRQTGSRCPDCWDPIGMQATKADCPTCKGTGRTGGYYPPVKIMAAYQPSTKQNQVGEVTTEPEYTGIDMMNFPLMKPKDVIYEINTGRWWLVNTVSKTEDGRVIVSQLLQCKRLDPTRIENDLPLPNTADSEGLQLVA